MNDIQRRDRAVFIRELVRPGRILLLLFSAALVAINGFIPWLLVAIALALLVAVITAWQASIPKRFRERRFLGHWRACEDRLRRFDSALRALKKRGIADLEDLPRNVEGLSSTLYIALRRADQVAHEISTSEGWLTTPHGPTAPPSADAQAQELYRMADRNVAEYRQHIQAVLGGVQRTEAQAIVFVTTLDTLRVKMLGYRLTGRSPEVASDEFLQSVIEAKMQLAAIDQALDELELTHFPKTITIVPDKPHLPPIPNHPPDSTTESHEEQSS